MHGNKSVTNINYGTNMWTTERFVADADPQNICARILFLLIIFSLYIWLSTWYNIDKTKTAGWLL